MTGPERATRWSLACRDLGYSCEWALHTGSVDEIQARFRDHARCAHGLKELGTDLVGRVADSVRPA